MKESRIFTGLVASLLALLLFLVQPLAALALDLDPDTEARIRELISDNYYQKLDLEAGTDPASLPLEALLESLDRYSQYLDKDEYKSLEEGIEEAFGGLGVRIQDGKKGVVVMGILPGSPAERTGIQIEDVFMEVDGQSVQDLTKEELVRLLRGPIGKDVLLVLEDKEGEKKEIRLTRELIDVSDKLARLDEDKIGYFSFHSFSKDTFSWYATELNQMEKEGVQGLILDLRGNSGGVLSSALNMAAQILDRGEIIAGLYREDEMFNGYYSRNQALDLPIVVLANKNTASASELLIAALRGNGRAQLVGQTTFGKGVIQSLYLLPNEGRLKLTTQEYRGPLGERIQDQGLRPDYLVALAPEESKTSESQGEAGQGPETPEPETPEIEAPGTEAKTDPELALAKRLLKEELGLIGPADLTFYVDQDRYQLGQVSLMLKEAPKMVGGRLEMGLRELAEILGFKVSYQAGTIQIEDATNKIVFQVGKKDILVNGSAADLPRPLTITEGKTYLPLRYLAHSLGYGVHYDSQDQTIALYR